MGKPLRIIALIAAAALMFVPGVGNAVGAFIIGSSAAAGGSALLGTIVVGAITAGLGIYGLGALRGAGASLSAFDPKSINADPAAPRKLLLGQTAIPVDLKYAEPSGTDQEFVDYIFALAAHKSTSIDIIYIENDLAWTAAGGAQGKYVGYLTVEVILEAGPGAYHTVNAGTTWGSTTRMTGSTTMKVRAKRSANSKNSQSPFSSGIAGRWAVIGNGIPVYDPARDSTVAGGSGSQRANDQTTWLYTASGVTRGNNPALQILTYLLGWRIGGQISVGVGLPADTLDVASFAVAAALCDEPVALSIGGTQRRFETGRAFSDADDPLAVIGELLKGMNGELVDDGGRLALRVSVNDLVYPVALTDDDFVSGYAWQPTGPIDQQFTVVRGRYSEPTPTSLYSMVDYPEVAIPRTSIAPRPYTLELSVVQDQRRAERIAKQTAQRNLYQGIFNVTLGVRGWQLTRNQVVAVTSNARGWTGRLFRVRSMTFNPDATIEVTLREEDASIYAWDQNESTLVTPVPPVVFDSRNAASWLMADIAPGADVTRTVLPALQRGAWSASSVAYALGDIVTRDGSSYTCIIVNSSTGANGPPGANWALLANAGATGANGAAGATGSTGAQGPTGVSAPPIKSLSTGAAQLDPIRLVNGQTVTAAAELYLNTGGVAGVCSLTLQISETGAGSFAAMTSGSVTDSQPTSEPVELVIAGATFTNSGADRLFDIRAISTRQSRSVNVPPSYVRVL